MNFDFTITFGNLVTLIVAIVGAVGVLVRQSGEMVKHRADSKAKYDLVTQRQDYTDREIQRNHETSQGHWGEIRASLQRILDKLDNKADKDDA